MTEPDTSGTDAEAGASRRGFLGGLAAAGALYATSGGVGAQEDDGQITPEVVARFDPPNLPENIAVDGDGTLYVSMAPTGEIRRVAPDGTGSAVATLPVGENGLLLGVVATDGTLHAALASGDPETHGVWRIPVDGDPQQVASMPPSESVPNGVIRDPYREDAVLVTDHLRGAVWRVTGGGDASVLVEHPLLEPNPYAATMVGADGIDVHPDGDVFVDNLNHGGVVRIPVDADGTAGTPEVYVQDEALVGCDGMAFAEDGTLYLAVNAQNKVSRVTQDKQIETVVEGQPLDFPADVHFGRTGEAATSMYVANFAYPAFLAEDRTANPSLVRVDVGVRGFFPQPGQFADGNVTEGNVTEGNATGNATGGNATGNATGGNATEGNVTGSD